MRTNKERMELIWKRTETLQQKHRKKKRHAMELGCVLVCLVLVISLGASMPRLMEACISGSVMHNSGAASLIADNTELGYIMVAIGSFLLGCIMTVLLYLQKEKMAEKQL